jgi:hypothetical protein
MSDNWPARGLISARVEPPGTLVLGCDCGTTTRLVVQDAETLTEIQEIAVTCEGCCTVRWITVSAAAPGTAGPSP